MSATPPPTSLSDVKARLRALLPGLKGRYPIGHVGIFGSWVRGEQHADSDLDLLIDFDGPIDAFAFIRLQEELSRDLGVRVDLVERPGLKPFIGAVVRREVEAV